jgi:hypothetical protein
MTLRRDDIEAEAEHWLDYQRQQEDAARCACAWDHAEDRAPARTWLQLLAALAYTAVAALCAVVIIAAGFLA